jgi:hypothetical protein
METTDDDAPPSTTSWWNQKRNKIFVSVTLMTVSIALSVGVFVSSRGNKTAKQANTSKASGGHETATIAELSTTSTPRGTPTASSEDRVCKIMATTAAWIDDVRLYAPQPDASSAKIAIDGKNLVVVSRGATQYGFDPHLDGEKFDQGRIEPDEYNVYVEFYSLEDNVWKKVIGFQEEDITDFKWEHGQRSVSLSGTTAVVIFPSNSAFDLPVYTYSQNYFGLWQKVSTGLPEDAGKCLYQSFDVDNGLMATFRDTQCGLSVGPNSASIYEMIGGIWKEAGEIIIPDYDNIYQVALSGDTIAVQVTDLSLDESHLSECHVHVYQFDRESGSIALLQDKVGAGSGCPPMVLDGNYMVHGLSVYHRQGISQQFALQQTFDSADYEIGFGKTLALDNEILVVGSDDRTYMFSLQNDAFVEVFALDQKPGDTHEISNGMIVTSNQDVFNVTIIDCTEPVPALTYSPTEAPTSHLTMSSTPSTTNSGNSTPMTPSKTL